MKYSTKVILFGVLGALLLIISCLYFNADQFLEDMEQNSIKEPTATSMKEERKSKEVVFKELIKTDEALEKEEALKVSSLEYKVDNHTIYIGGKMPLFESSDPFKQTLMSQCKVFKCNRTIVFSNEQADPLWKDFARNMITLFHEENLTAVSLHLNENEITIDGELEREETKKRLSQLIYTHGLSHEVNDTSYVVVKENLAVDLNESTNSNSESNISLDPIGKIQENISEILKSKQIHFHRNRARITTKSQKTLNEIIEILKGVENVDIEVQGYTDASGKKAINRWISLERAKSVKNYLGSRGVNPRDITAKGFGETGLLFEDQPYS
ncbi:MAG: OmpA family protein, partial [Epsilonproteobacteria bacterium]|nr:OmpA family protein [Campylobacterota bacterium]